MPRTNLPNEYLDGQTEGSRNVAANSRRAPSASPARTSSSVAPSAVLADLADDGAAGAASAACWNSGLLEQWCRSIDPRPAEGQWVETVLERCREANFQYPQALAALDKSDLEGIVKDLKIGEKGHFLLAVDRLRDAAR